MIVGAFILSWLVDKPIPLKPLLVSKFNTVVQIALVGVVLAAQGFNLSLELATVALTALVTALTLLSILFYVAEWVRHMNTVNRRVDGGATARGATLNGKWAQSDLLARRSSLSPALCCGCCVRSCCHSLPEWRLLICLRRSSTGSSGWVSAAPWRRCRLSHSRARYYCSGVASCSGFGAAGPGTLCGHSAYVARVHELIVTRVGHFCGQGGQIGSAAEIEQDGVRSPGLRIRLADDFAVFDVGRRKALVSFVSILIIMPVVTFYLICDWHAMVGGSRQLGSRCGTGNRAGVGARDRCCDLRVSARPAGRVRLLGLYYALP